MKEKLIEYIKDRLIALIDVDDYDGEKLIYANLLYFLKFVSSDAIVKAKLNMMVDADKKQRKYLQKKYEGDDFQCLEYSVAKNKIGRECLKYLGL